MVHLLKGNSLKTESGWLSGKRIRVRRGMSWVRAPVGVV